MKMEDRIPMFVYGTLRPHGRGSQSWGYTDEPINRHATISGKMWFSYGDHGYPVVKVDQEGTIVGDIIYYDPTSAIYHHVCDVETGAGYKIVEAKATCLDGSEETVMVWHYKRDTRRLTPIPSGDWLAAEGLEW